MYRFRQVSVLISQSPVREQIMVRENFTKGPQNFFRVRTQLDPKKHFNVKTAECLQLIWPAEFFSSFYGPPHEKDGETLLQVLVGFRSSKSICDYETKTLSTFKVTLISILWWYWTFLLTQLLDIFILVSFSIGKSLFRSKTNLLSLFNNQLPIKMS